MIGNLEFDAGSGRMVIINHNDGEVRELHCGDCFQLHTGYQPVGQITQWCDVRIEHGKGGWYLIGVTGGTADADVYLSCPARTCPR